MRQDDQEMMILLILLIVGFYAYQKGLLTPYIEKIKTLMGGIGGGSGAGGVGGGKGCGKTVYTATGQVKQFGSPKKSTHNTGPRVSWKVENVGFKAMEATAYITVKDPKDKGEEVSFKFYGPSHSSDSCCAWYFVAFGFDGKVQAGYEKPHPDSPKVEPSAEMGVDPVGKSIGMKAVIWPNAGGAHLEAWIDTGAGFKKLWAVDNPGGQKISPVADAEMLIRIDQAQGSTMECGDVREINPPSGGGAAAPAAYAIALSTTAYETTIDYPHSEPSPNANIPGGQPGNPFMEDGEPFYSC